MGDGGGGGGGGRWRREKGEGVDCKIQTTIKE